MLKPELGPNGREKDGCNHRQRHHHREACGKCDRYGRDDGNLAETKNNAWRNFSG